MIRATFPRIVNTQVNSRPSTRPTATIRDSPDPSRKLVHCTEGDAKISTAASRLIWCFSRFRRSFTRSNSICI